VRAGTIQNALVVPDDSVLRDDQNEPFVYKEVAANQFARQSVNPGESEKGLTQILSGLKPGDRVVGNGSLFLQFKNSLQH
jgi:membrane fusion protein, heavy metal efflux system